jgi:hypothetical protein
MIANHIIRMASTRAKARALRDLSNIGITCLEELGDLTEVIGMENAEIKTLPQRSAAKRPVKAPEPELHVEKSSEAPAQTGQNPELGPKNADPALLGPPGTGQAAPATPVHEKPISDKPGGNGSKGNGSSGDNAPKISEAQRRATINLARRRGISIEELEGMVNKTYGVPVAELTASQASTFIRQLQSAA